MDKVCNAILTFDPSRISLHLKLNQIKLYSVYSYFAVVIYNLYIRKGTRFQ